MKVLVAEDDEHTRQGLVEILEAEGYQVIAARDGKEALELYDRITRDYPHSDEFKAAEARRVALLGDSN